jgi:hypothetical protein
MEQARLIWADFGMLEGQCVPDTDIKLLRSKCSGDKGLTSEYLKGDDCLLATYEHNMQ